jgi:hypothetical protein
MKKIIRLTESDLAKIIKKVISETQENVQNFVGIKMKKIVVDKNSDGTLGDKTMITLSNGDTVTKDMINNISDECGSGGDVNSLLKLWQILGIFFLSPAHKNNTLGSFMPSFSLSPYTTASCSRSSSKESSARSSTAYTCGA